MNEVFREIKENLTMEQVAGHLGFSANHSGFILSPFNEEKTASCKLYRDSYYDFSSATGGDLINFTARVLSMNNWQAAKYLCETFSLPISLSGTINCEEIEQRQRERQLQRNREKEFKVALLAEIRNLKRWEQAYQRAIDLGIYPPMSGMHSYVICELQKVTYKLDILCGADMNAYKRMKPHVKTGMNSQRPQWLLDALAILEECGSFMATQSELEEIKAQRDFELLERRPGKDRECNIAWIKRVVRNKYEDGQSGERGEGTRIQKKQTRSERWTELSQILGFQ